MNLIIILISYLLGSISPAYIIGKMRGIDLRKMGSGNLGTTNTLRNLGKRDAIITMIIDILKGFLAAKLGAYYNGDIGLLLAGLFVVLGHNFPVFLNFKGGKGMATTVGVLLAYDTIIGIVIFIFGWIIALLSGYMSLAALISLTIGPFILFIFKKDMTISEFLIWLILAILGLVRHKDNIKRLIDGNENKMSGGN